MPWRRVPDVWWARHLRRRTDGHWHMQLLQQHTARLLERDELLRMRRQRVRVLLYPAVHMLRGRDVVLCFRSVRYRRMRMQHGVEQRQLQRVQPGNRATLLHVLDLPFVGRQALRRQRRGWARALLRR